MKFMALIEGEYHQLHDLNMTLQDLTTMNIEKILVVKESTDHLYDMFSAWNRDFPGGSND